MLAEVEERFKVSIWGIYGKFYNGGLARSEDGKIDYSEFVSWAGSLCKDMEEKDRLKEEDLKQLFDLLDRDEDDYLEFSDILTLVFSMDIELYYD